VEKQRMPVPEDAEFAALDISSHMNCALQDIFKQQYLSPRPEKGSTIEIGYDGFDLWTMPLTGIETKQIEMRLEKTGEVITEKKIPIRIAEGGKNVVFTSLWDNFPTKVEIPVNDSARSVALAVSGSTNPMQCGIENAEFVFTYEDGETETLPLINPHNYIQLCAYQPDATQSFWPDRADVFSKWDAGLLKHFTPEVVSLGKNLRTLVITWPLKEGKKLMSVSLEALSPDVVVGLMAITLMK